ncbi:hypothetical protein PUR34_19775 [Streptomyces sp. JV185]|uniref:hypothetical protein n=1 Tax=Streptomyces sp. JV185 TaxID=858638 RepID=UPI002E76EFFA|nr:hypothetical protein [Streptomyces sp. JV185]MEE1770312.1 hypothetical protein [Streptomyces sp. JV185]
MGTTTGRTLLSAVGPEKPSPEPVLTFRDLPERRALDRCTTGAVDPPRTPAAGPAGCAFSRSGVILRIRTGATGAGAEEAEGVIGVPAREASAARWTAAGCGADPLGGADTTDERTGISEGAFGGVAIGVADAAGAGSCDAPCCGAAAPG